MRVRILVSLSLAVIFFGVHKEAFERHNQSPDIPTTTQTSAVEATPDRKIQILHPQRDVAGKDGAITIITGFSEAGQRIVATTDGEGTCGVGMPEGEFDKNTHQFTGREFPNTNPIYLTIYSDGSGGQLEQLTRDGSTEKCGASASFHGG